MKALLNPIEFHYLLLHWGFYLHKENSLMNTQYDLEHIREYNRWVGCFGQITTLDCSRDGLKEIDITTFDRINIKIFNYRTTYRVDIMNLYQNYQYVLNCVGEIMRYSDTIGNHYDIGWGVKFPFVDIETHIRSHLNLK